MQKFIAHLTIRVYDLNYGGHLANDRVLSLFHEARVQYLQALDVSESDIGNGVALTQTEAYVAYKGEGFLGDQLDISVWIDEFSRTRFRVNYTIVRQKDEKTIATGYTMLAAFDYAARKPKRIPEPFKEKVRAFQKAEMQER